MSLKGDSSERHILRLTHANWHRYYLCEDVRISVCMKVHQLSVSDESDTKNTDSSMIGAAHKPICVGAGSMTVKLSLKYRTKLRFLQMQFMTNFV